MSRDKVQDAHAANWVDRFAPEQALGYLRMMRADRPIGVWLFYAPFAWSLILAAPSITEFSFWYAALFLVFAFLIRGAGCVINDIVDRDLDAMVERTRSRPLPSGQVSLGAALLLGIATVFMGFAIAYAISYKVFLLSLALMVLVVIYPTMKRITWWPQAFLSITFNWGSLLAWVAVTGSLDWTVALVFAATAFWIFGYDTVYAHQDKMDDLEVNIKSSALALGNSSRLVIGCCYAITLALVCLAAFRVGYSYTLVAFLMPAAALLFFPLFKLDFDNPSACLKAFVINQWVGVAVFLALLFGKAFV